jgi:hypothetical protein
MRKGGRFSMLPSHLTAKGEQVQAWLQANDPAPVQRSKGEVALKGSKMGT